MLRHLMLFVLKLRPIKFLVIDNCIRSLHSWAETAGMVFKLLVVDCSSTSSDLRVESLSNSTIYLIELLSGKA
jgi:hypothetical protein